jgi:hypothetical protein
MSRRANRITRLITSALCAGSLQLASPAALPQEANTPAVAATVRQKVSQIREQGFHRDNALAELVEFEKLAAQYRSAPDYPWNDILTMLYEAHSFLGNHAASLRVYDDRYDRYDPDYRNQVHGSTDLPDLQSAAALTVLDELAERAQVIMINEAHHVPLHRDFTRQALTLLRKKGFTYFAAETFEEDTAELRQRGYPIITSGRYTREPIFAEMVRTAIREGYELVAYDGGFDGGVDAREQAQARNLIERVLKRDPKAKLLVHAGYGHIIEHGDDEYKHMAEYFKEWSGIDPFTINQTDMMEHSSPEYEAALYAKVLQKYNPAEAIVLRNVGGEPWSSQPGKFDLTVFHPRTTYRDGRPAWLATRAGRMPYTLPNKVCGRAKACLVQARLASESDAAIAIDQIEVKAGQTPPATLMLPAGEFNIAVQDAAGKQIRRLTAKMQARAGQ